MSSLIPKQPKLLNTRTRKKDFDLSSEKEKTSVLDAKVVNLFHSSKSKPSNSNDKNENSWASNIEQEEKPVGKGKQKVIPSTSKVHKAKSEKTRVDVNTKNNKQADTEHMHITHNNIR